MKTSTKDMSCLDDFFNVDDDDDLCLVDDTSDCELIEQQLIDELDMLEEETPEKTPKYDIEDLYDEEDEVDDSYVIDREIRNAVSNLITELEKSGTNLKKIDIIVRKIGDKYVAKVDDKRDLKLKEIFKDEL